MNRNNFYVTTPIYYVNDRPHIGHAYTTIFADILRKYHSLFGFDTYLLTGVDEHGQKVSEAATRKGISPQEHCDLMAPAFENLWKSMKVDYNRFIRTTDKDHQELVVTLLQKIYDQGDIYTKNYEGWYDISDEIFYMEKDLVDGKSPAGHEVQKVSEKNYFFKMSEYQKQLIEYIKEHPKFIFPENRKNEVLGFLKEPLEDLCISRPKSRVPWGIEMPFDKDYVTYVWFDALINYLTGIGYGRDQAHFEKFWPQSHHIIGKDILTTHAVYWSTMLMALGISLPRRIIAHGWWLYENSKMSKSQGNVVSPLDMRDSYGDDVFRYYLANEMGLGQDANFTEALLVTRHNADLANDLGNLYNRIHKLSEKYFAGKIPSLKAQDEVDQKIHEKIFALPGKMGYDFRIGVVAFKFIVI